MIFPSNRVRILVATNPVDFRKAHDGLNSMVHSVLHKDPFTGTVFVFRAKRLNRLKLLYWDGSGVNGDVKTCRWGGAKVGQFGVRALERATLK